MAKIGQIIKCKNCDAKIIKTNSTKIHCSNKCAVEFSYKKRGKNIAKEHIIEDLRGEIWKDIYGYEGSYLISNKGRIKSITRSVNSGIKFNSSIRKYGKLITPKNGKYGYRLVILYKNGKGRNFLIHRLVAAAFLGNNKGLVVNHIDFNRRNNNVENLEWCTYKQNTNHALINGRINRGVDVQGAKLTDEIVREIRKYKGTLSGNKTADIFHVSRTNVYDIWNGKIWKHVI